MSISQNWHCTPGWAPALLRRVRSHLSPRAVGGRRLCRTGLADLPGEIEHERDMTREPDLRRRPMDLLDQPCLADAGLATDIDGLSPAGFAASHQRYLPYAGFSIKVA